MKNPVNYFRQLLSVRLSLWIVLFAAIIFIGALSYMFQESRRAVREEAISHATQILDNTVQRVNSILDEVETATRNTVWLPEKDIDNPDAMRIYTKSILENNPDLYGCALSFTPNYYKDKGYYYSIYSFRENGEVNTVREGDENYQYFSFDWFLLPKLLDKPCWTEPYVDAGLDTLYSSELIISYGIPLKDKAQEFAGVISVDISLSWLSQLISAVKPYPNSYSIMIGQGGTYLVHPDSTKLFYQTIFTETLETPDTAVTSLGHAMLAKEEGMKQMVVDGMDCYVFYKPLEKIGWSVAIVCPESDIFGGYNRLRHAVLIIVLIGLLLMLFIVSQIITKELKPLRQLDSQAQIIASGKFDQSLLDSGRVDEIGRLTHSFGDMQQSLVTYMNELKEATAQKERIESELRIASDIQMSMVPRTFPPFPERKDIDLYASMTPAKEVGGDLYNFFLKDECLYFAVGDVSGKGVPASLFMAQATRLFRTLAGEGFSPVDIANRMNSGLCEGNDTMMFVTMFIGVAHLDTGKLDFCNCGHNPPTLDGQFVKVKYKNRPLGLWEGDPFHGESIDDIRGLQLLVYTDGLNEAMDANEVQFGNDRLLEITSGIKDYSSYDLVETLRVAVENHRVNTTPSDDLTLLCLRIAKSKNED